MAEYKPVAELEGPDGIRVPITNKEGSAYYSFTFLKEYEHNGKLMRTGFFNIRHIPALRQKLDELEKWFAELAARSQDETRPVRPRNQNRQNE